MPMPHYSQRDSMGRRTVEKTLERPEARSQKPDRTAAQRSKGVKRCTNIWTWILVGVIYSYISFFDGWNDFFINIMWR